MSVIFDKVVEDYLSDLVQILYDEEYFGFVDSAYRYVDTLIDEIVDSIENVPHSVAPEYFSKYGRDLLYFKVKKNDSTHWYIFFNYEDGVYFIRYIGNNYNCSKYL